MNTTIARRILVWLTLPLGTAGLLALAGMLIGTVIGDALGSPEGEGFIGFILGMRIGAVAGLVLGAVGAALLLRRLERPGVSDPTSGG